MAFVGAARQLDPSALGQPPSSFISRVSGDRIAIDKVNLGAIC